MIYPSILDFSFKDVTDSDWWGLLDEGSRQHLQAILTKMQNQGLLLCAHPTMMELCDAANSRLFVEAIPHNPHHVPFFFYKHLF